jgi:hypothetical protein
MIRGKTGRRRGKVSGAEKEVAFSNWRESTAKGMFS